MTHGINIEALCKNQRFTESQVVSSEMVYPRGAVPNAQLMWFRVELTNGERFFITKPLADFYQYIDLPESSIGGWTDGDRGSDSTGHFARYALDDSGDGEETSGGLLDGAEGAAEAMETAVAE